VIRVGLGYDIHRLEEGRRLVLGGVEIPFPRGEAGHSDGDALIHALIDALLGAAGLGDIGSFFPPSDPALRDIESRILLRRVRERLEAAGWRIGNLDGVVILEAPLLAPWIPAMKKALAEDLGIPEEAISIKGKTKETLESVGQGKAVEALAVALLERDGR
jgi:2-C-methyl-D-erythritol 2,4-cyclodiphosphate synthase